MAGNGKPTLAARQVEQSTFDEIVAENIDLFGLSGDEAIAEAKEQLLKTGIADFSNLILSPASTRDIPESEPANRADSLVTSITKAVEEDDGASVQVRHAVLQLLEAIDETPQFAGIVGARGAVDATAAALIYAKQQALLAFVPVCRLLAGLCASSDADRARFAALHNIDDAVAALKYALRLLADGLGESREEWGVPWGEAVLCIVRAVVAVQRRTEGIKRRMASGDTPRHLLVLLQEASRRVVGGQHGSSDAAMPLFSTVNLALRQLASPDDAAVAVSEAFVRARVLSGGKHVTDSGLRPLGSAAHGENNSKDDVPSVIDILAAVAVVIPSAEMEMSRRTREYFLSECLATVRACTVADEICKAAFEARFHDVCVTALREFSEKEDIVVTCMRLLRNMAGRDECKTPLYAHLPVIRQAACGHQTDSARVAEAWCAVVAQLTLRRPDIAAGMAEQGVVDSIVRDVIQPHAGEVGVLRSACLAVRNVVSRSPAARERARQSGEVERVLREVLRNHGRKCDNAYYALREMDVLEEAELRRDERYTMPANFRR